MAPKQEPAGGIYVRCLSDGCDFCVGPFDESTIEDAIFCARLHHLAYADALGVSTHKPFFHNFRATVERKTKE